MIRRGPPRQWRAGTTGYDTHPRMERMLEGWKAGSRRSACLLKVMQWKNTTLSWGEGVLSTRDW